MIVAANTGVDTMRISVGMLEAISESKFSRLHETLTGRGLIRKLTNKNGLHEPRCAYYPDDLHFIVEVSLPKFFRGSNVTNLTPAETEEALDKLDDWLGDSFGHMPASVRHWRVKRVDFATSWQVGDMMAFYLNALASLSLPRYERRIYPRSVAWQNKSRKVQFYDKFAESNDEQAKGLLRFEVASHKDAVAYMAHAWFGVAPTLSSLLSHSDFVVASFLARLGVDSIAQTDATIPALKETFGSRWAQAQSYLHLLNDGIDGYKAGLVPRSTWYRYKRQLAGAGLCGSDGNNIQTLPRLVLSQNLDYQKTHPYQTAHCAPEIFPEFFEEVSRERLA